MPNTHSTLTSLFTDIADAIRAKTNSNSTIVADDFPTAISNIPSGGGMQLVQHLYDHSYKFSETNFASWTPSTNSATMVARGTTSLYQMASPATTQIPLVLRCKLEANYAYQSGTTAGKGMMIKSVSIYDYVFSPDPATKGVTSTSVVSNLNNGTLATLNSAIGNAGAAVTAYSYYETASSIYGMFYNGTSYTYGVYFDANAPYSTTGSNLNFYTPKISVRCNASNYFTTTYANLIDQTSSTLKVSVDLYSSPMDRALSGSEALVDVWQNGITIS